METIKHNLEKEKKFLKLFGYSIINSDNANYWHIIDKNKKQIGHIKYKNAKKQKNEYDKTIGYYTMYINSSIIKCEHRRKLSHYNINNEIYDHYSFYIKRDNQKNDLVEMCINNYPSIMINSDTYGLINFYIDNKKLYLKFQSHTDKYNFEETLVYNNTENDYPKEYTYKISYYDKNPELQKSKRTTREISGTTHYYDYNNLTLLRTTWVNRKCKFYEKLMVKGTVEEMAIKHQTGINCFNYFDSLINQVIPFEHDIISSLVTEDIIKENNLSIFFPEYNRIAEKEEQKKLIQKK